MGCTTENNRDLPKNVPVDSIPIVVEYEGEQEYWSNVPTVLIRSPYLSANEVRLYLVLFTYKSNPEVLLTENQILKDCNYKRTCLYKSKAKLKELNLLRTVIRATPKGTVCVYQLKSYKDWLQERGEEIHPSGYVHTLNEIVKLKEIDSVMLRVYLDIKSYAGFGKINLASATIMRDCGISKPTYVKAKEFLISIGLLEVFYIHKKYPEHIPVADEVEWIKKNTVLI